MKKEKNSFVYDRTLRELFQTVPKALIKLLVNKEIKEVLETSFPKVEERRVDLLTRLEDDTLFHLEIQSINDSLMPKRMLKYASLIYENYDEFPKQMVLYVGDRNIKIKSKIKEKNLRYNYEVKDIRQFHCSKLIESDDITDNIIAILCNIKDIDKLFTKLQEKLLTLDNKKREDYLRKLFYLLRLRPDIHDIYKKKQEEELAMPFIIEKERDPLYKDGLQKGLEKVKEVEKKGILKGQKEREITIAKALLKQGVDIEVIVNSTELSVKEVKKLSLVLQKDK
jgi:predicted transposase/invertase (TIGR01784 family)